MTHKLSQILKWKNSNGGYAHARLQTLAERIDKPAIFLITN